MQITHVLGGTQQVESVNVTDAYSSGEQESPCPKWSACVRISAGGYGALRASCGGTRKVSLCLLFGILPGITYRLY